MPSRDRWDTRPYLPRLGDALSQFVNVALANGMPDESLSGRAWRNTYIRAILAPKPITERGAIDPITGNGGEGRKTAGLGGAGGTGVIELEWEE